MKKKTNQKVLYFHAPVWDSNSISKRNLFIESCKEASLHYELVDVDTCSGSDLSVKYGVKNVPTAVFLRNNSVYHVEKGNNIHEYIYSLVY